MTECVIDKEIRYGKLPSGLTYYIRHNETPKGLACFYLVKNIGSVTENDDERGLAHFLEHMSFEGTVNFPGNSLSDYLKSIGVRYGEENNAYTSAEETVYQIKNVPVTEDNCRQCVQILMDWISGLTLTDEAIELERSIILEEFRVTSNPFHRMLEKALPALYPNSKYGNRLVIGIYDFIKNFPSQKLRDFYHKWSRPDLSAVVIVGDFDADMMEKHVRSIDIPSPLSCNVFPERVDVPDNEEPIIALEKDPEQKYCRVMLALKKEAFDREYIKTYECLREAYTYELIVRLLNLRFSYIANGTSAPFFEPNFSIGNYILSKTKQALDLWMYTETDLFENALKTAYREILKAVRFGFTMSELEKAKNGWLASMQYQYNDRDHRESQDYAEEYVKHFTRDEPLPSIEDEYAFSQKTIPSITLEQINQKMSKLYDGTNLVVCCMLPESSSHTESAIREMIRDVDNEELIIGEQKDFNRPLLPITPVKGSIVLDEDSIYGYHRYILSNGLSVYLKTTSFNNDEIMFLAFSKGGNNLYSTSLYRELFAAEQVSEMSGLGEFSKQDLYAILDDKQLELVTQIIPLQNYIRGKSSVRDFRHLLEILYLFFTSVRYDRKAFDVWKEKTKSELRNNESNYLFEVTNMVYRELFEFSDFYANMRSDEVDNIDYDKAYEIYKECFYDASPFTFIITGNISEEELIPYMEQYIASLPCKKNRVVKDLFHRTRAGNVEKIVHVPMESPSSYSLTAIFREVPLNLKNMVMTEMLSNLLETDLISKIRQEDGDVYMIYTQFSFSSFAPSIASVYITFQTNVGVEKEILFNLDRIVESYSIEGPSDENIASCKEYLKKKYRSELKTNRYFQNKMNNYLVSSVDGITDYESTLENVIREDLISYASFLLKEGTMKRYVLTAEKES